MHHLVIARSTHVSSTHSRHEHPVQALTSHVLCHRLVHFAPSAKVEIKNGQRGPVNSLDVDPIEERFLLVGAGDATVALYDMEERRRRGRGEGAGNGGGEEEEEEGPLSVSSMQITPRASIRSEGGGGGGGGNAQQDLLYEARRNTLANNSRSSSSSSSSSVLPTAPPPRGGHRHSVTAVQWYPLDTGLFVSGSSDGTVRVWDTNTFNNVGAFDLGSKVHAISMSPAMRTHSLVAAGTDDRRVRLCDLKSGGCSHLLMGHSEAVLTVAWSPTQEHLLATGSRDSTVRLWDIRRSGPSACLLTLDQHADHHRKKGPGLLPTPTELAKAHDGWVVSVDFSVNGAWLVTAGTDKRVRLWNACTGENTLMNYVGTRNERSLGWRVKTIQPGGGGTGMVLYPNGGSGEVLVFPLLGGGGRRGRRGRGGGGGNGGRRGGVGAGQPLHRLRGHLDAVNSMVYRRDAEELITGGVDGLLLVFDCSRYDSLESQRLDAEEEEEERERGGGGVGQKRAREGGGDGGGDNWSSDEEDKEGEGGGGGGGGGGFVPPIVQQLLGQQGGDEADGRERIRRRREA